MAYFYLACLVLFVIYIVIVRPIRKHTKGMGLGFKTASAGDSTKASRDRRYIRMASMRYRDEESKWKNKARKAKRPKKQKKYLDKAFNAWWHGKHAERIAAENIKEIGGKSQGIRIRGTERGRWWEDGRKR